MTKWSVPLVVSLFLSVVFLAPAAFMQSADSLSERHLNHVRTRCSDTNSLLRKVHANDASVYVDRNQVFFTLSDKLMVRLNTRLSDNKIDSTKFVGAWSEFDTSYKKFRDIYKSYDAKMVEAINIDCKNKPQKFYTTVKETRALRKDLNDEVKRIQKSVSAYRKAFNELKDDYEIGS